MSGVENYITGASSISYSIEYDTWMTGQSIDYGQTVMHPLSLMDKKHMELILY
jgi:hypothetical protein